MISRPTLEPIVRTAERAADSARPSCLPPRGPVEPNSTSLRPSSMPPPAGVAAVVVPATVPAGALVVAGGAAPALAATRPLSFSYADSRSTAFS